MTRRLGAGAGKTQGKLGSMLIQLISQRGWRAVGGRCARRFSARGRRWQRKNWGMPAPVIVLPSSVISKIRRGRREGGSVARTRQRCTPPHAHAAILQAALASRKMAAGAHAASGPQLAHPSGFPSASPEAVGTQEQWQREKGAPGEKELLWWAGVRWQAAILAWALLAVPRRWARSTPTALSPARLAGTILVHFSFTRQHTLPGPCLCPLRRLCPCHGFPLGHEWAYPHMDSRLPQCVPVSSEGCQALDWPSKTQPGQIEHSESYKARCHLSIHQRVSYGQIIPFS